MSRAGKKMYKKLLLMAVCCSYLSLQVTSAEKSADEIAKELSNPGAANATLNFKLEYRNFDGDLSGANDQDSLTGVFQPVFPFILPNGNNLIFRPAFSYIQDSPSFNTDTDEFDLTSGWSDIPYDILYSWKKNGFQYGAGLVGSIPTGGSLSSENWLLGPSALLVRPTAWGIWGLFPFHNEKIGGDGPDVSFTSLQYFWFYGLGDGWQAGTGPTISYDWEADSSQALIFPVQLSIAKTKVFGRQPIKFNFSVEKNVINPDAFSEDWTVIFTVSPVIKNPFQK